MNPTERTPEPHRGFLAAALHRLGALWPHARRPPKREEVPPQPPLAAPDATGPKSLRELGLDATLVDAFESMFQVMGLVDGAAVTGWTFRSKDGTAHALRLDSTAQRTDNDTRAA